MITKIYIVIQANNPGKIDGKYYGSVKAVDLIDATAKLKQHFATKFFDNHDINIATQVTRWSKKKNCFIVESFCQNDDNDDDISSEIYSVTEYYLLSEVQI
jgi:hypothetical protein